MSAFHVGQKIICVDGDFSRSHYRFDPRNKLPQGGAVYTVRGFYSEGGEVGLYLKEIVNPIITVLSGQVGETCFNDWRFRPLAFPKQSLAHDVAQFLKIADRAPAPKKRASVKA